MGNLCADRRQKGIRLVFSSTDVKVSRLIAYLFDDVHGTYRSPKDKMGHVIQTDEPRNEHTHIRTDPVLLITNIIDVSKDRSIGSDFTDTRCFCVIEILP